MEKKAARENPIFTNKLGDTGLTGKNRPKRTTGSLAAELIKSFSGRIVAMILSAIFTGFVLINSCMAFISMNKTIPEVPQAAAAAVAPPVSSFGAIPASTFAPVLNFIETSGRYKNDPKPEPIGKPNIYFFILDEYSSFDMLSKYYGYDNKVFNDFLEAKGFNISRESYSTDNETEHSICDTVNLNYISRHFTKKQSIDHIADAKLFNVLSGLGYSQFQLSYLDYHFNGIVSLSSKAGKKALGAITVKAKGPGGIIDDNSGSAAFSSMLKNANGDTNVDTAALNQWDFYSSDYVRNTKTYKQHPQKGYANSIMSIFDYFENPSNYPVTTPRVTYCYMTANHVPFVFNEYGGLIPSGNGRNWRDTGVYLGQYKYMTKQMMDTLTTIISNDPDSIIVIMSDHGIRYHADCALKHKFYITDKDSLRIMNAVYIKGQKYDIEGLSAINTWRYIVSLYGLDYPPINDPVTAGSPDNLKGIIPKHR